MVKCGGNDLVSCENELSCCNNLVTCRSNLLTGENENDQRYHVAANSF